MKPTPSKIPVIVGLVAATAGVVGLTAVVRQSPETPPGELKPEFQTPAPPAPERTSTPAPRIEKPAPKARTPERTVRAATLDGDTPILGKSVPVRPGESPERVSLAATLANLDLKDVRILRVAVERGVATIDASPGLQSHGFSSSSEAALVNSVAVALGQFPGVKSFRFRVDGEVLDTLGHLEMTEPQPVIRPGQKVDAGDDDKPTPPPSP